MIRSVAFGVERLVRLVGDQLLAARRSSWLRDLVEAQQLASTTGCRTAPRRSATRPARSAGRSPPHPSRFEQRDGPHLPQVHSDRIVRLVVLTGAVKLGRSPRRSPSCRTRRRTPVGRPRGSGSGPGRSMTSMPDARLKLGGRPRRGRPAEARQLVRAGSRRSRRRAGSPCPCPSVDELLDGRELARRSWVLRWSRRSNLFRFTWPDHSAQRRSPCGGRSTGRSQSSLDRRPSRPGR